MIFSIVFMSIFWTVVIGFNSVYAATEPKSPEMMMHCPSIANGDDFTQSEFINRLTHSCRYDRLTRPGSMNPLIVAMQLYIYHLEAAVGHDLQFKVHTLVQFRYLDDRLAYSDVSPNRTQIIGEALLRDKIWVPHIYLTNEKSSSMMGMETKDVLVSISPAGEVIFSTRLSATLYCWMNLQKFPFDEQNCSMIFESWTYNIDKLQLEWEIHDPVTLGKELHLTEFSLIKHYTNETQVSASMANQFHGSFYGNYSRLLFTFHLSREIGFYLLDYFIPSMMIVAISWVSFWIQADNSAPRVTLGTSTMLSFITLASAQGKNLPRVSYIKTSEIWFLGCTGFIFGSLVEFAFVNTIWRQKQNIELKKVNTKYVLKSTLTPKLHRKELEKFGGSNSSSLQKSHSCSSLQINDLNTSGSINNYLTVHEYPNRANTIPIITTQSADDLISGSKDVVINVQDENKPTNPFTGWTTMTPQEIAQWIDSRSKIFFPAAFLAFNILYWSFVYIT